MSHAKHGLKALGLCLMAALSVMAVMAAGAQAATVLEAGTAIVANLPIAIVKDSTSYILHSEAIGGTKVLITCTTLGGTGSMKPDATGTATFNFTGCSTELNGAASMVCLPKEPIVAKAKAEAYLHNGEETALVSPEVAGTPFTTVKLDKEAGCAIGPNFEVKGSAILLECKKALLTDQKQHLFEQVVKTSHDLEGKKNSLVFGTKEAQILGSAIIELATGSTWAVHV